MFLVNRCLLFMACVHIAFLRNLGEFTYAVHVGGLQINSLSYVG